MTGKTVQPWQPQLTFFHQVCERALPLYDNLDASSLRLLEYSENATYYVENENKQRYVLRICRPHYHTKTELHSEILWIQTILKDTKVQAAAPIKGKNGSYLQTIEGEHIVHCILFTFLDGSMPDIEQEKALVQTFETIGSIAAQLHEQVTSKTFQASQFDRPVWDIENLIGETAKWGRWQEGVAITPDRERLFAEASEIIKKRLAHFGKANSRFGLIHGDLRHANLLIDGKDVKVIDFDDSGFSWFLFDLAASLTFIEHRSYVPALIQAWLTGYRKYRTLSVEEEREVPTFIMMRRLQCVAWVGSRANETTNELGVPFTVQTEHMAKKFIEHFG